MLHQHPNQTITTYLLAMGVVEREPASGPLRRVLDPADDELVDIDLLVVADCPNEAPAADLLRSALDQAGLPAQGFRVTVIADEQAAARRGFTGSPTFLINGSDPFRDSEQPTGLTCRLYRQPAGRASVLPALDDLRDSLTTAAQGSSTASGTLHD